LIPLLDQPKRLPIAVLLSLPGWFVILFAYNNDSAWYAFTMIAPGLLGAMLCQDRQAKTPANQT
jgi:hypothetical protein